VLLKDIVPGDTGSLPESLTALGNGKVLFAAHDGVRGPDLWVTVGTAAGTALVKDINPGATGSAPYTWYYDIVAIGNGKALFQANDGTHGAELWVTDGTAAGTALVRNINPDTQGTSTNNSILFNITAIGNGKALLTANDGSTGYEVWLTDGTGAGTALLKDITNGAIGSSPYGYSLLDTTALHNQFSANAHSDVLFRGQDGSVALWQVNGTEIAAGTVLTANPGGYWSIAGTGDFDGDGKADILWRGQGGEVALWQMNGGQITEGTLLTANPGGYWSIAGTGDFGGDGRTDILWRGQGGEVALWQMNGGQIAEGTILDANPGAAWSVASTGDFDGDGQADILWRGQNGEVGAWLMHGGQIAGAGIMANPGEFWSVIA
jgi:ELWxxDGT repeat protein